MAEHFKKIILHTGNILEREELVRKVGQSTLQELHASIKTTLNFWPQANQISESNLTIRGVPNEENSTDLNDGVKITVKIFMSTIQGSNLADAIQTVKRELNADTIHSVIIMPPDVSDDLTLTALKPAWKTLEACYHKGVIQNLGIAEISPRLFKQLFMWADVKPSIIQVNVSSCCTISEDLTDFADEQDIQILTHYDDPEVIDEEIVDTILSRAGVSGLPYEVKWLARHRGIQTCYGLVSDKGYSLALELNEE